MKSCRPFKLSFNVQPPQQQQQQTARRCYPGHPSPPEATFETFATFDLAEEGNSRYRVSTCTINKNPYVSFSHYFFSRPAANWCQSHRQIALPKAVFEQFIDRLPELLESVKELPPDPREGMMNTFYLFLIPDAAAAAAGRIV